MGKVLHLHGKLGVSFPEHIGDAFKVIGIPDQHTIVFHLLWGQSFDDVVAKGGGSAIFRKGETCPFGLEPEHLLLIDTAPKLDELPFHFPLFSYENSKRNHNHWTKFCT